MGRETGRAPKNNGLHLYRAVAWYFDHRGPTAAAKGYVETDPHTGRPITKSDPARNVTRSRREVERLLSLITLEVPTLMSSEEFLAELQRHVKHLVAEAHAGRVLSAKNKSVVKNAISAIGTTLSALQALLDAAKDELDDAASSPDI
jgi:hypothetical protein